MGLRALTIRSIEYVPGIRRTTDILHVQHVKRMWWPEHPNTHCRHKDLFNFTCSMVADVQSRNYRRGGCLPEDR